MGRVILVGTSNYLGSGGSCGHGAMRAKPCMCSSVITADLLDATRVVAASIFGSLSGSAKGTLMTKRDVIMWALIIATVANTIAIIALQYRLDN